MYAIRSYYEKHPGVILIHGGGWASSNKSHLVPLAQELAANGFVATSVEYRLSPEAKYPAGVIDLKTAIKWFKQNGSKFNLDTMKIAVLGTTGGNSVFLSHPGFEGISDQVQAIVNMDRITSYNVCYTKLLRILIYILEYGGYQYQE